jgi:hypothetical protein
MADLQQLTVTLNAKIDQFKSGMAEAVRDFESSAGKIDTRNQQLTASISKNMSSMAESTRFLAGAFKQLIAVATIEKIMTGAIEAAEGLAQMARSADLAGVSVKKFQEIQFAAKTLGGADPKDLEKTAHDLTLKASKQAREEEGDLFKLLEANNQKLTDRNGKVKDFNELLNIAANLIQHAGSPAEALEIGKIFNLNEEQTRALKGGAEAFQAIQAEAKKAGAVIDDEVIQRAQKFDAWWSQSWSKFGTNAKAAAASAAGYLASLNFKIPGFEGVLEGLGIFNKTLEHAKADLEAFDKESEKTGSGGSRQVFAGGTAVGRDTVQAAQREKLVAEVAAAERRAAAANLRRDERDAARNAAGDQQGFANLPDPQKTKIPSKAKAGAESTDDFERAYNQLLKQKEGLESQAKAEGLVGRAYDEAVASEKIFQAAQEAGIKLTAAQTAEVHQLAGQYADLKQQLAGIKFDKDIKFDFQQLGRTKDEQAVFSDLRGRGIDEGSEKFQKAADELRTLHGLTDAKDTAGSFLKGMISDLENGVKAGQALENQLKRIADKLLDKTIDAALSGLFGSGIGKIFGFGGGAAVPSQAAGGWIGSGPMIQADPRMWRGARAFAQGGGVPVLAHAGEIILNQAQQKNIVASMAGGQAPPINVNHAPVINGVGLTAEQVAGLMAQNNKDFTRRLGTAMDSWNRKFGRGFG